MNRQAEEIQEGLLWYILITYGCFRLSELVNQVVVECRS